MKHIRALHGEPAGSDEEGDDEDDDVCGFGFCSSCLECGDDPTEYM